MPVCLERDFVEYGFLSNNMNFFFILARIILAGSWELNLKAYDVSPGFSCRTTPMAWDVAGRLYNLNDNCIEFLCRYSGGFRMFGTMLELCLISHSVCDFYLQNV